MHHGRKLRVAILRQNCTMAPACLHLSIMLPLRNATVVLHVSRRRVRSYSHDYGNFTWFLFVLVSYYRYYSSVVSWYTFVQSSWTSYFERYLYDAKLTVDASSFQSALPSPYHVLIIPSHRFFYTTIRKA